MSNKVSPTELIYTNSLPIDKLSVKDALDLMLDDQLSGVSQIKKKLPEIEKTVELIVKHFKDNDNGRIIYCGAGTSGRIGMQDCVELYPTFGWPLDRSFYILAGGKEALTRSIENSEDDIQNAKIDAENAKFTKKDLVIGIAASGNTIFTVEVLKIAKQKGALTIAISNNPKGNILKEAKSKIILDTQQEVIAGSTRLKAGTSQKVCLNLISTMLMIQLGKVKDGQMINMIPTNIKLKKRKLRIQKYFKRKISD